MTQHNHPLESRYLHGDDHDDDHHDHDEDHDHDDNDDQPYEDNKCNRAKQDHREMINRHETRMF